jgi:hypothetical protein
MRELIFVSYSQADRRLAFELVAYLEAKGLSCWIAPRDITPSAEWAAEIIEAISAAKLLVLVFSRSSNESPQVRREIERAVHKRVPVIAFRIEDVLPERSLEYFLSAQHWLDAFPGSEASHFEQLFKLLQRDGERAQSPHGPPPNREPARPTEPAPPRVPACSDAQLAAIARQLAHYLGPIAKILVQRAAPLAANIDELSRQLAAEIASEPERRAFLAAATATATATATARDTYATASENPRSAIQVLLNKRD